MSPVQLLLSNDIGKLMWHHLNDDDVGGGLKKIISFFIRKMRRSLKK